MTSAPSREELAFEKFWSFDCRYGMTASEAMTAFRKRLNDPSIRQSAAALEAQVPEGWVIVPREPTPKMIEAMSDAGHRAGCDQFRMRSEMRAAYPAMLSAAPSPPAGEGGLRLKVAATAFLDRVESLQKGIDGMFQIAAIHGATWKEENNWTKERDELRAALSSPSPTDRVEKLERVAEAAKALKMHPFPSGNEGVVVIIPKERLGNFQSALAALQKP